MTSVDAYLDQACMRLRVNPAEADEIREELRAHLEELLQSYRAGGVDEQEATELALAWFGDPRKLHDSLDFVHQGDAWWVYRLKGLALGLLIGGVLGLIAPIGGHLEFVSRFFGAAGLDAARLNIFINALLVGGLIGMMSAGGRSIIIGWSIGSFIWLTEYIAYWMISVSAGSGASESSLSLLNSVLPAPLLGGIFGILVGLGSATVLSITSRARPEIR